MNRYHLLLVECIESRQMRMRIAAHHAKHEYPDTGSLAYAKCYGSYLAALDASRRFLQKLASTSDANKQKSLTLKAFQLLDLRLAAVITTAYFKGPEREDIPHKLTLQEACTWAAKCRNLRKDVEPIYAFPKKNDGKVRWLARFGPVRYAQQLLLSWLLLAQRKVSNDDFFAPSSTPESLLKYKRPEERGIDGAARRIGEGLEAGLRFWATGDLKNAYSSVGKSHIRKLFNIHETVLRNVCCPVFYGEGHSLDGENSNQEASRSRLPQGSAHAWIVLSALIDEVLSSAALDKSLRHVVFGDNIAVGARDIFQADCALRALNAELVAFDNPVQGATGKLILQQKMIYDGWGQRKYQTNPVKVPGVEALVQNAVDFCGYRVRWDVGDQKVAYSPAGKSWAKLYSRIRTECAAEVQCFDAFCASAKARYDSWANGFPLWPRAEQWEEVVEVQIIELHDKILAEMAPE